MKTHHLAILIILAVLSVAAFTACGDDDDNGSPGEIRTESGLGVALVATNADLARSQSDEGSMDGGAVPGPVAPAEDAADRGYSVEQVPLLQQTSNGITVSGYGTASVEADSAVVEFYFGSYGDVRPEPAEPGGSSGSGSSDDTITLTNASITVDDLQPVIDALVGAGVDRDDIEFLGSSYYYDAYWYSATLRVTVRDLDILGDAVGAATDASLDLSGISLQSTYISYVVEDCGPLEEAALAAAVDDAEARADAFASALGVPRGTLTGAQTYSYSPFGGSPCSVGEIGPYPVAEVAYTGSQPSDVTLYANVMLTYGIE